MKIIKKLCIINPWVLAFSKDNKTRQINEVCVGSEGSFNEAIGSS